MPEANSNSNMLCSLLGDTPTGKDGEVMTSEALTNKTAIALYFSAHGARRAVGSRHSRPSGSCDMSLANLPWRMQHITLYTT